MKKNEIINEIKNVVMNNGGEVKHGQIRFFINENGDVMVDHCTGRVKNIKNESKSQLENDLATVKMFVEMYYNTEVETVEVEKSVKDMTKAETVDTEYVAEPKATKKDIIMGLYKDGSVECDLTTAEALAQEGFIIIDRYEDGMLYGFIFWDAVEEEVMDEDEMMIFLMAHSGFENWGEGYKIMKELYSKGYLVDWVEDEEKERCYANQNTDKVLSDFCKRWNNKLNEAA